MILVTNIEKFVVVLKGNDGRLSPKRSLTCGCCRAESPKVRSPGRRPGNLVAEDAPSRGKSVTSEQVVRFYFCPDRARAYATVFYPGCRCACPGLRTFGPSARDRKRNPQGAVLPKYRNPTGRIPSKAMQPSQGGSCYNHAKGFMEGAFGCFQVEIAIQLNIKEIATEENNSLNLQNNSLNFRNNSYYFANLSYYFSRWDSSRSGIGHRRQWDGACYDLEKTSHGVLVSVGSWSAQMPTVRMRASLAAAKSLSKRLLM